MAKREVTIIPAIKPKYASKATEAGRKRRVAAYARVSTDSDEQFTSFEAQVDYYTKLINAREDWEFVKVYTDEYNKKTIQCYGVSAPHKHKKAALRVENHSGGRLFAFIGFLFCWRGVRSLRIPLWLCAYTPCVHPCRGFVHPLGQSQKVSFQK